MDITYEAFLVALLGARTFDREWGKPDSFQEECLFELFAFDNHCVRYIRPRLGYRRGFDPNMLVYVRIKHPALEMPRAIQ
jgi:hypothetical protein